MLRFRSGPDTRKKTPRYSGGGSRKKEKRELSATESSAHLVSLISVASSAGRWAKSKDIEAASRRGLTKHPRLRLVNYAVMLAQLGKVTLMTSSRFMLTRAAADQFLATDYE